jgi:hypothetical protein
MQKRGEEAVAELQFRQRQVYQTVHLKLKRLLTIKMVIKLTNITNEK